MDTTFYLTPGPEGRQSSPDVPGMLLEQWPVELVWHTPETMSKLLVVKHHMDMAACRTQGRATAASPQASKAQEWCQEHRPPDGTSRSLGADSLCGQIPQWPLGAAKGSRDWGLRAPEPPFPPASRKCLQRRAGLRLASSPLLQPAGCGRGWGAVLQICRSAGPGLGTGPGPGRAQQSTPGPLEWTVLCHYLRGPESP